MRFLLWEFKKFGIQVFQRHFILHFHTQLEMIGLLSLMWLLLAVSCTPTLAADSASTDGPLPNFVFIMMDDW